MTYSCKNCGQLISRKCWEENLGLCIHCYMLFDLENYYYNNIDNLLEEKREKKFGQ